MLSMGMNIRLNSLFYTEDVIRESLHAFTDVCPGEIVDSSFVVRLDTEDEEVGCAFQNYALSLMCERRKA